MNGDEPITTAGLRDPANTNAPDPRPRPALDPAAVEAAVRAWNDWPDEIPVNPADKTTGAMRRAITAYLDRSGLAEELEYARTHWVPKSDLAEARASLEREKVNRDRDGQTFADETDRLRAERDEAVEARENANALSIRLEGERDRAVERAEAAEASLAAATEALEGLVVRP